jgi:hypothetical protein
LNGRNADRYMPTTPKKRTPKKKPALTASKKSKSAAPNVGAPNLWARTFRPGSATLVVGGVVILGFVIGLGYAVWPILSPHLPPIIRAKEDLRLSGMEGRVQALERVVKNQREQNDEIKSLNSQREEFTQKLSGLMKRLEKQEKALNSVKTLAKATTLSSVGKDTSESLKRVSGRLAHLEKDSEALSGVIERIATLEKQTARKKAENARQAKAEIVPKGGPFLARETVLAALQVRDALRSSAPFVDDLKHLKKRAAGQPDIEKSIAVLEPYMKSGVLTLAALRNQFDAVASDIVRTNQKKAGKGWVAQTLEQLSSLVSIRKTGANSKGSDVQAIVARAEGILKTADLMAVVKTLETLPVHLRAVAAEWIRNAKARSAAERAIAALHIYAVAYMAPASSPASKKQVKK